MTVSTMEKSVLTLREALGLVGDGRALIHLADSPQPAMRLTNGALLFITGRPDSLVYELLGTAEQIDAAFDDVGGRAKFAEPILKCGGSAFPSSGL